MLKKKKGGFTLVELMVVIVIIGILAALAIPKFMNASIKAKVAEGPLVLKECETLSTAYYTEVAKPPTAANLGWGACNTDGTANAAYSDWYNYTYAGGDAANGVGTATLKGINATLNGKTLTTTMSTAGAISHGGDNADLAKYVPAFFQ